MIRNHQRATHGWKRLLAGKRMAAFIDSFLCAVMATSVAQAGETDAPDRSDLDRDVSREVTQNEDGSKTITISGSKTHPESVEVANFSSSRTITETEIGREWTSEGTRTNFDGETISTSSSGSVVKGEDSVTKTQERTVTNETTGEVRSQSNAFSRTETDDGVQVVGSHTRTGPDGETVTREFDRTRPPRSEGTDRSTRPDGVRPDRPPRPNRDAMARPARADRSARAD